MWMCVDEDDNIMCGCGRFTWETQSVTLQSDSPVGMTKHGFNALSSNAVVIVRDILNCS